MGWGSILGKIGAIGAGVAAPFTGGASLAALGPLLGMGGSALGAYSQGQAQNRDAQFSGQMDLGTLLAQRDAEMQRLRAQADNDYTSNQIARSQEGRASGQDAWRKLLSAQHTLSPSQMPNVSPYAAPQRQATDTERQGADALSAEVMARLQGGNPIAAVEKRTPAFDYDPMTTIDPRLLKPGKGERISGILAPILGIGGGLAGRFGAGGQTTRRAGLTPPFVAGT